MVFTAPNPMTPPQAPRALEHALAAAQAFEAAKAPEKVAMAQVAVQDGTCDLLNLFVEPDALRQGYGFEMLRWAIAEGRRLGAHRMTIVADPNAVPFYERAGAREIGSVPSGSIPGRRLPLLELPIPLTRSGTRRTA